MSKEEKIWKPISGAFEEFMETDDFKSIAKQKNSEGGKFRMLKTRYYRKELDWNAMLNVLCRYGYEIVLKANNKSNDKESTTNVPDKYVYSRN